MSHLPTITVEASDAALEHTFEELKEVQFELDNPITGQSGQQWPCLWITGHSKAEIESALRDDPTVDRFETVTSKDDAFLYDLDLSEDGARLRDIIQEANGTILAATGAKGQWELKLCFDNTDDLSQLYDRLTEEGITPEIREIRNLEEDAEITDAQRDVFEAAFQDGYFQIPREITLEGLATGRGISEQTVSTLLHQGYKNLTQTEVGEESVMFNDST